MRRIVIVLIVLISTSVLSSCYIRIGQLAMVSTRNVDSKTEYVLIQKNVQGIGRWTEALEAAIDAAVKKIPTGEFLKNVAIELSYNGRRIRVTGDVWGTVPSNTMAEINHNENGDVRAIQDYTKAIELNPKDAVSYYNRGNAKFRLGDIQGAIQDYTKAIELNPKDSDSYNNRGLAKDKLGNKKEACLDWSKAGELGDAEAYDLIRKNCN